MIKRMLIMLLLVAAICGGIYGMWMKKIEAMSNMPPPPPDYRLHDGCRL